MTPFRRAMALLEGYERLLLKVTARYIAARVELDVLRGALTGAGAPVVVAPPADVAFSAPRYPKTTTRQKARHCIDCDKEFTPLSYTKTGKPRHNNSRATRCEDCRHKFMVKHGQRMGSSNASRVSNRSSLKPSTVEFRHDNYK